MNIGIISNYLKDKKYETSISVIKWLNAHNITPFIDFNISETDLLIKNVSIETMMISSDIVIVIGGDGTLLNVASTASRFGVPVFGFNMGTLGYLTSVEKDEIFLALEKLLSNDYTIDERIMIETNHLDPKISENYIALNDFVITKGLHSKLISLEIFVNDTYLGLIRGDGLIISTPTGSTAYNLSANGPILEPNSNILVVTPICPQNVLSAPFVISSEGTVKVKVSYRSNSDVALSGDGQIIKLINNYEEIIINASKYKTKLVKVNNKNFYDVLRQKLMNINAD